MKKKYALASMTGKIREEGSTRKQAEKKCKSGEFVVIDDGGVWRDINTNHTLDEILEAIELEHL